MKVLFALLTLVSLTACSAEEVPTPTATSSPTPHPESRTLGGIPAGTLPLPLDPVPDCPITPPSGGVPPGETRWGDFYHGEDGLWVGHYGTVIFEAGGPGMVGSDGSLSMKFMWWRPEKGAPLSIDGRRLDASAAPLGASIPYGYQGQHFQATSLSFPSQGCWEVTGRSGDATLRFVTLVLVKP